MGNPYAGMLGSSTTSSKANHWTVPSASATEGKNHREIRLLYSPVALDRHDTDTLYCSHFSAKLEMVQENLFQVIMGMPCTTTSWLCSQPSHLAPQELFPTSHWPWTLPEPEATRKRQQISLDTPRETWHLQRHLRSTNKRS